MTHICTVNVLHSSTTGSPVALLGLDDPAVNRPSARPVLPQSSGADMARRSIQDNEIGNHEPDLVVLITRALRSEAHSGG